MVALLLVPVASIVYIYILVITVHEIKAIVILSAVTLLFINILLFICIIHCLNFYSSQMNERVFEQMLEVYSYQLDIAQESEERVKALRHDIKHHIIELSAMARKNNNDEMAAYLTEMQEFMLNPKRIRIYRKQGDRRSIKLYASEGKYGFEAGRRQINIPEGMYLNDFNICVILGNLVDNAVRAASKSEKRD